MGLLYISMQAVLPAVIKRTILKCYNGSYLEKVKLISAAVWVTEDAPATVVAYGTHDKMQPFLASLRLKSALEEHGVDYKYFEAEHSGHGLQNDSKVSIAWMKAIEEYLDKYMGS